MCLIRFRENLIKAFQYLLLLHYCPYNDLGILITIKYGGSNIELVSCLLQFPGI